MLLHLWEKIRGRLFAMTARLRALYLENHHTNSIDGDTTSPSASCAESARRSSDAATIDLGRELAKSGRLPEAVRLLQGVILADHTNIDAWRVLGEIVVDTGQLPRLLVGVHEAIIDWSIAARTAVLRDPLNRYSYRQGLPLGDIILDEFMPNEKFVLLDGGAREAENDARWGRLDAARVEIHGFEPESSECARLNALASERGLAHHYYPVGLWGTDDILPFHENHASGGSSFLHQNRAVTDRWKFENPTQTSLSREIFHPKCTYDVKVTTVETWARDNEISAIDFIKLNVQGGELEILRTAGPVLDTVLGVLSEVSFCESYLQRPFFSDIDVFLRSKGFVFFDLLAHHYIGRECSPIAQQHFKSARPKLGQLVSAWGQLIEGHALYLRDPIAVHPACPPSDAVAYHALKLACISEIYGQIEYAFELLRWVSQRPGFEAVVDIRKRAAEIYIRYY